MKRQHLLLSIQLMSIELNNFIVSHTIVGQGLITLHENHVLADDFAAARDGAAWRWRWRESCFEQYFGGLRTQLHRHRFLGRRGPCQGPQEGLQKRSNKIDQTRIVGVYFLFYSDELIKSCKSLWARKFFTPEAPKYNIFNVIFSGFVLLLFG